MDLAELLLTMHQNRASDLILKVDSPPLLRVDGEIVPLDMEKMKPVDAMNILRSVADERQLKVFKEKKVVDIAFTIPELARFRVNIFRQRKNIGLVFRLIPLQVPKIEELNLPKICTNFALRPRGLVMLTGPSGCGKSFTIAGMIEHRNQNMECHIVTVEDPIEFTFNDKKALINQREIGSDTLSYSKALKAVLRHDPDCIVIGELKDLTTISQAITAAETGHLVLATLHTVGAVPTVERLIDVFPGHQQPQIRMQISANLIGVISQVLVKKKGGGRIPAFEILVTTAAVRNLIREGKTYQISTLIQTGHKSGMILLNQSLTQLVKSDVVSPDEALSVSPDRTQLRSLIGG